MAQRAKSSVARRAILCARALAPAIGLATITGHSAVAYALIAAAPKPPVGFDGAWLGMGIKDWKSQTGADTDSAHVSAACSGDAAVDEAKGAAPRDSGTVTVCRYVKRYGPMSFPVARPLSPSYSALDTTYSFADSRLAKIEFKASIDAFNAVVATLTTQYGPATTTVRDTVESRLGVRLPRVRKVWRLAGGRILVTDPAAPPTDLSVEYLARRKDRPPVASAAQP